MAKRSLPGLPLALGALLTGLDVMLIIALQHHGIRKLEATVAAMAGDSDAAAVATKAAIRAYSRKS